MRTVSIVAFLSLFLMLASCAAPVTKTGEVNQALAAEEAAKQREVALDTARTRSIRLQNVAYPMLLGATDLCKNAVGPILGMTFHSSHSYSDDYRSTAIGLYGVGDALQTNYILKNSPAYMASVQEGDIIISVNGKQAPVGKGADAKLAKQLAEAKPGLPMLLTVLRDGEQKQIDLVPVAGCKYPVVLQQDDAVNAFANGELVVITSGMMRFVENDQELALVIGHEIAHNAMNHIGKKTTNYALGSIFDIVAAAYGVNTQGAFGNMAAGAYSQEFESEADYVGLYLAARSNVEIDNAPLFWRRMAAEHPGNIAIIIARRIPRHQSALLHLNIPLRRSRASEIRGCP